MQLVAFYEKNADRFEPVRDKDGSWRIAVYTNENDEYGILADWIWVGYKQRNKDCTLGEKTCSCYDAENRFLKHVEKMIVQNMERDY